MGFELPPYPYDLLDPYKVLANQHSGGVVDLSVGTPCDPPLEEAVNICAQTLYCAAAYARESDYDPATLRAMVTSKGGTTAEGINVLENSNVREIIENCVRAAYNRSKELSQLR